MTIPVLPYQWGVSIVYFRQPTPPATEPDMKTQAKATFDVYTQLGILDNAKKASISRYEGQWEIWCHFQSPEGRKNARVAQFDNVDDAVEFERLVNAK